MGNSLVAVTVVVCIVLSASLSAEQPTLIEPSHAASRLPFRIQISELLRQLGIRLVPMARAAECTAEGETCKSTEQCCLGSNV